MEEKLLAFVSKALNMNEDEIKEILEDESNGGLEALTKKYSDHVKSVKDTGYKAGERKVNTAWENKIKADFNIQSETKGIELIDEVQEVIESKATEQKPAKDITVEAIKKHPEFIKMETAAQEAERRAEEKYQKILAEKEEAYAQKELFNEVKSIGLQQFESLKPILSSDPNRAAAQKQILIRELENYKFQKEGNEFIVLKPDGDRLENETGHRVKFEDVVKNITTQYFDLQTAEPRASTGRKPDEQTTTPSIAVPKNREEYIKYLDSDAPASEKEQVKQLYYAQS
ncbi:hypothetical protein [Pontibacter beigongshangensis]|uniref:hypothetical protein n=1 Tax=Pontibacter beigongshangensis TaxID=2574733 RepID=UPI00164FAD84|nr:hypothetical protein [Pontibacter beigongshangensis]